MTDHQRPPKSIAYDFAQLAAGDPDTLWEAAKGLVPFLTICGFWFRAGLWKGEITGKLDALEKSLNEKTTENASSINKKTEANTKALDKLRDEVREDFAVMRAEVRSINDKFDKVNVDVAFLTGYRTAQERGAGAGASTSARAPASLPSPQPSEAGSGADPAPPGGNQG